MINNQGIYPFFISNELIDFLESICDAIREKGPTIQKIDFRIMCDSIYVFELIFHGVQSDIFYLRYFARYELLKKVFERVQSSSSVFNRSPCKFLLLDRRSLSSDSVTYGFFLFFLRLWIYRS